MLLLVPVLAAVVIARLRGGSLHHLANVPLRGGSWIVSSLGVQVLLYVPGIRTASLVVQWSGSIYIVALALALVGALRNWGLGTAARIALLGLVLNVMVIAANGGHMPVAADALRLVQGQGKAADIADHRHYNNTLFADAHTHLAALSDIIPVPAPGGRGNVYSIGDALLAAGVAALAYRSIRGRATGVPPTAATTSQAA